MGYRRRRERLEPAPLLSPGASSDLSRGQRLRPCRPWIPAFAGTTISALTHSDSMPRLLQRLPGAGRDPFLLWAPAFAGVTEFLGGSIGPSSTKEAYEWV